MSDQHLDALRYALRREQLDGRMTKVYFGWRKVLRWLASRPLERVARTRRLRERPPLPGTGMTEEVKQFYNRELLKNSGFDFRRQWAEVNRKLVGYDHFHGEPADWRLQGGARGGGKGGLPGALGTYMGIAFVEERPAPVFDAPPMIDPHRTIIFGSHDALPYGITGLDVPEGPDGPPDPEQ